MYNKHSKLKKMAFVLMILTISFLGVYGVLSVMDHIERAEIAKEEELARVLDRGLVIWKLENPDTEATWEDFFKTPYVNLKVVEKYRDSIQEDRLVLINGYISIVEDGLRYILDTPMTTANK